MTPRILRRSPLCVTLLRIMESMDRTEQQMGDALSSVYLVPHTADRRAVGRRLAAPLLAAGTHREGLVLRGAHPDLIELSPPEGKQKIGIAQVREVIRQGQFSPVEAPRKVCLLPVSEALTLEAANALLKVLEEPPRGLLFLLLAEHQSDILPTILSRSRIVRLAPSAKEKALAELTAAGYTDEEGRYLLSIVRNEKEISFFLATHADLQTLRVQAESAACEASPEELFALIIGPDPILRRAGLLLLIERLIDKDRQLAVAGARFLARGKREETPLLLEDLLSISFAVARQGIIPDSERDRTLASLSARVHPTRLFAFCLRVERAWQALERYTPPEAIFFSLFLALGEASRV